jgi:hypothetical protein
MNGKMVTGWVDRFQVVQWGCGMIYLHVGRYTHCCRVVRMLPHQYFVTSLIQVQLRLNSNA